MKFNVYFRISSPITSIHGIETPCTTNPVEAESLIDLLDRLSKDPPKLIHQLELVGVRVERIE
jgi:hypothetical protein